MNSPLPFVPRGAKARGMARRHSPRHPLFRQRWFADDIIITCVRWYLRFKLSYRELAELARELGVSVAPSTVLRWVVRYVPEFEKCWQAYERPVGDSWRVDETYLKVGGQWVYLYRSVDKQGKTVESYLSRTRDVTAAKAFFRKALKRHGEPRVITLDGFEATHAALRRMGMNNEFNYRWENPVQIRTCPYLNNIVEQDHRRVKSRVGPMLGFKRFFNARRRGRCGVGPEDRKRSVRCSRKLRHGPVLYMVQHAGGVNLAPICNRSRSRIWCKLLKGSVSCDNCRDDGTDLGTRSVQGTAL
jgi:transposase-like protein